MGGYSTVFLLLSLALVMACAVPASAQQASSFEQLQLLVKPGDVIVVTDSSGKATKGKIESLSSVLLRLNANKNIRDYSQIDAVEIKQRRPDPLGNGALGGALAGAGFGGLVLIGCSDGGCDAATVAGVLGIFTGLGAGVGVGIDALIIRQQTIYRAPRSAASSRVRVAPVLGGDRKGVAVAFSF